MEKVRYEEMLPHEIVERRRKVPIAFIALGGLEWHGEHLALGNDALKAEKLCELAASKSGGFAFPTMWYGEPHDIQYEFDYDDDDSVKTKMGFKTEKYNEEYFGTKREEYMKFYRQLIYRILVQINTLEMKVVCLVPGHYPLHEFVHPVVKRFNEQFESTKAFIMNELDFMGKTSDVGGDHAGKWETSYLWYLRPECVDLSVYNGRNEEKLIGVVSGDNTDPDPRKQASKEIGRKACSIIVDGMVKKAVEILKNMQGI